MGILLHSSAPYVRICYVEHTICSQPPVCNREIFRRVYALYSHWSLTTAYYVAGHVQKYHYPSCLSSPPLGATQLLSYKYYSLAFLRSWRTYEHDLSFCLSTKKVPEDLIFNCQKSVKKTYFFPSLIYGHFFAKTGQSLEKNFCFFLNHLYCPSNCSVRYTFSFCVL